MCSQLPLAAAAGRTCRRRPATCCCTHTVSPGARCRCRRTGWGSCTAARTASCPARDETDSPPAFHRSLRGARRPERRARRGPRWRAHTHTTVCAVFKCKEKEKTGAKRRVGCNLRCTFLIKGSLQTSRDVMHSPKAFTSGDRMLEPQPRRMRKCLILFNSPSKPTLFLYFYRLICYNWCFGIGCKFYFLLQGRADWILLFYCGGLKRQKQLLPFGINMHGHNALSLSVSVTSHQMHVIIHTLQPKSIWSIIIWSIIDYTRSRH